MPEIAASERPAPRLLLAAAALFGLLIAGTVALWAHFGTTVFFEMVRAGIAACF